MIDVIDAVIKVIDDLRETDAFKAIMDMDTSVKLDDPGLVLATEYPYIYVSPIGEAERKETIGRAGYEVKDLAIEVCIVIDQSEYYDADNDEVSGTRELLQAASMVRDELKSFSNRGLGGLARGVKIPSIQYEPQMRGDAFVRMAKLSLIVERQYAHR
jgi:hypothetical protein